MGGGTWLRRIALSVLLLSGMANAESPEYRVNPGDVLKVSVFKNPDLSQDLRVAENGTISFPFVGTINIGHLTLPEAEQKIAHLLNEGGFVRDPQVNILLTQALGNQIAVLGQVNRPGRYSLDTAGGHLSGVLLQPGGRPPDRVGHRHRDRIESGQTLPPRNRCHQNVVECRFR